MAKMAMIMAKKMMMAEIEVNRNSFVSPTKATLAFVPMTTTTSTSTTKTIKSFETKKVRKNEHTKK